MGTPGTGDDAGQLALGKRQLRLVSAPPTYVLAGEKYRYRPTTNTKASTLEVRNAPVGMLVRGGAVEWEPTAAQAGTQRGIVRAQSSLGDTAEQELEIAVATSTLRAEGDATATDGASVFATSPSSARLLGAGVRVPPRALQSDVRITVGELDRPPPLPNAAGVVRAVRFGPSGTTFAAPAQVTLPVPEGVAAAKSRLGAYVYDPQGRWRRVPLVASDLENGFVTAAARHFSIYAAVQSSLDLELALGATGSDACEPALAARALVQSPLSEVELASVNNLSETLRARIAGESPSVLDLLRLSDFTGSLRVVQVFDLSDESEAVIEQRVLASTLYVRGDGTATVTHTDALGNVLAQQKYDNPLAASAEIQERLRGGAVAMRFATEPTPGLSLTVRVHVGYLPGDAALDAVSTEELGIAAVESAVSLSQGTLALADRDCDGVLDTFDAVDDRLAPRIEATPEIVASTRVGQKVKLTARLVQAGDASGAWTLLDATGAKLDPVEGAPDERSFTASEAGRFLVSYRADVGSAKLEHVFAIDVVPAPVENSPPRCQPSAEMRTGRVGEALGIAAAASDGESPTSELSIEWGLVEGTREQPILTKVGTLTSRSDRAERVLFAPTNPGNFVIGCRAYDGQAYSAIGTLLVSFVEAQQNRPPVDVALSPMVTKVAPEQSITLYAVARDLDADPLAFTWRIGGVVQQGAQTVGGESRLTTRFERGGVFDVEVAVSDGKAAPLSASATVLVSDTQLGTLDADRDGWPSGAGALADCNDNDPSVHPTAPERCGDAVDRNCDDNVRVDDCDYDEYTLQQGDCDDANPRKHPNGRELCDGLDNDCNGQIDEAFSVGKSCLVGVGACQATGLLTCSADGEFALCAADPLLPTVERCDRIDNDCDGKTDEDGVCGGSTSADAGVSLPDAGMIDFDASVKPPLDASETPLTDASTTSRDGGTCSYAPEICDGIDNDCDGRADNLPPITCQTGLYGSCSYGLPSCTATGWACLPINAPLTEICNGSDDDCDGVADDGITCVCDPTGIETNCQDGNDNDCDGFIDARDSDCAQSCSPTAIEYCFDGFDNDCNGYTDAADPQCATQTLRGESCSDAQPLVLGTWVAGTFAGYTGDITSSCYTSGLDRVYSFTIQSDSDVALNYNVSEPFAYSIQSGSCDAAGQGLKELSCKAGVVTLSRGTYYLVLEGEASGSYRIMLEAWVRPSYDGGTMTPLDAGTTIVVDSGK